MDYVKFFKVAAFVLLAEALAAFAFGIISLANRGWILIAIGLVTLFASGVVWSQYKQEYKRQ